MEDDLSQYETVTYGEGQTAILTTLYEYDDAGRLVKVIDALNNDKKFSIEQMNLDFEKIVEDHINDRVVAHGVSTSLKVFSAYREICREKGINFSQPIEDFMKEFVRHFSGNSSTNTN